MPAGRVGVSLNDNATLFKLTFVAKFNGLLSEALNVNSDYTRSEAYNNSTEQMDVVLDFAKQDGMFTGDQFALYQNIPNPFLQETKISFHLPEAGNATFTVYDVTGRVLKQVEDTYAQGYNEIYFNSSDINTKGVLFYRLATATDSAVKKMTIINQ